METDPSPCALFWSRGGLVVGFGGRWGPIQPLALCSGAEGGGDGCWQAMGSNPGPRALFWSGGGLVVGIGGRWRAMGTDPVPRALLGSGGVLAGDGGCTRLCRAQPLYYFYKINP